MRSFKIDAINFVDPILLSIILIATILLIIPFYKKYRNSFLLASNIAFVSYLSYRYPHRLPPVELLAMFLAHFIVVKSLTLNLGKWRKPVFHSWLWGAVFWFCWSRKYYWNIEFFFQSADPAPAFTSIVTYTYIFIRQITLATHAYNKQVKSIPVINYLNYNFAFWTFVMGPIQEYGSFVSESEKLKTSSIDFHRILSGLTRIIIGYIKFTYVAAALGGFTTLKYLFHDNGLVTLTIWVIACSSTIIIRFSGYSDCCIGFAKLVGFKVPEEYNMLFTSRNTLEIYKKFHITLASFYRNYIFYPLLMLILRLKKIPLPMAFTIVIIVVFAIMGEWHSNMNNKLKWFYYGMYQGLGPFCAALLGVLLKKYLSPAGFDKYHKNKLIMYIAILITQIHFFGNWIFYKLSAANIDLAARHYFGK